MSKDAKNVPALRFKGTLTLGKSVSLKILLCVSTKHQMTRRYQVLNLKISFQNKDA